MDRIQQCTGNPELLFHGHCPLEQGGILLWRCKTRFVSPGGVKPDLCPLQISDPEACDQMYESLHRIHTNFYKNKVRAVALITAPLFGGSHQSCCSIPGGGSIPGTAQGWMQQCLCSPRAAPHLVLGVEEQNASWKHTQDVPAGDTTSDFFVFLPPFPALLGSTHA